jgi:hypothetical protein
VRRRDFYSSAGEQLQCVGGDYAEFSFEVDWQKIPIEVDQAEDSARWLRGG